MKQKFLNIKKREKLAAEKRENKLFLNNTKQKSDGNRKQICHEEQNEKIRDRKRGKIEN